MAFAQAGQKLAPPGSVSTVRLLSLEARAHARVGDRPSFERAMGLATEAFDHLPEQSTGSIFSFSAPYFPYYGGSCYVWLHEPRRAVEQAERAIELCDAAAADWPVARVVARIDLATALVQLEQLEDACTVGTEALGIYASGRPIGPVVRRAAELRSALQRNQDLPAVRNFSERFHAVCSEQAAPLA